ncbi:MAG: hypothetical protein RIT25_544 [Planctomycetota bacterium]
MRPSLAATLLLACAACAGGPAETPWIECFDGASLAQWEVTDFGGQGPVAVAGGCIELGFGSPLTGINYTGTPPSGSYELAVRAARVEGRDFFCGLTFPVRDAHLTLVLGGWGGSLVGLSSLDGKDAARNETRTSHAFEQGRVYDIRVVVTPERVTVALDGAAKIDADLRGRELGLRPEVLLSRPLGIASFTTRSAIHSVRWRPLGTALASGDSHDRTR